jgi:phosphoribosylformylglycinamidine cyclo-ligase
MCAMKDAYAQAGVDIDAGNETVSRYRALLGAQRHPRILEGIGAFAGCYDMRGAVDPVLVASTDGIGTKVIVAAALGRHDSVGRDLVHHCINDILCLNARPLFFLDYFAAGKLEPAVAAAIVSGVAGACADFGVALLGGETAEMPGVYTEGNFDVAGTIVGAVDRAEMIDISSVAVDDVIIGLPANGFHTNGYSLVRRVLKPQRWSERVSGASVTIADALLAVHPCYMPYIDALRADGIRVKAMAHITGGGLIDNVPRVLPDTVAARFDRSTWTVPPIVAQVVREASLGDEEAFRTFNMGVGYCLIVSKSEHEQALRSLTRALAERPIPDAAHSAPSVVGEIEPRHPCGPAVIIS